MPETSKRFVPPDLWKPVALALLMGSGGWVAHELLQAPEEQAAEERTVMTAAIAKNADSIDRLEIAVAALTAAGRIPVYSVPEGEVTGRCITVNADSIGALLRGEGTKSDAVAVERCRDEMVALTERLREALRASAER